MHHVQVMIFLDCFTHCSKIDQHRPIMDILHKKQVGAPPVPSAVIRGSIEFEDFWCQRCVKVSKCVTSLFILNWQLFCIFCLFFSILELFCVIVSHCDTV
jgi:hypothetical protein